jgi:hypothetical protein
VKIATAQAVLRRLSKQAGMMVPLVAGAGLMVAADGTKKAIEKSREHHAGFNPNYVPGEHA